MLCTKIATRISGNSHNILCLILYKKEHRPMQKKSDIILNKTVA
jgi:hypothetical protein